MRCPRKVVAVIVSAALPLGALPLSAFAESNSSVQASAPSHDGELEKKVEAYLRSTRDADLKEIAAKVSPGGDTPEMAEARALFTKAGISGANIDAYLKVGGELSPLGQLLYRPMKERYDAAKGEALQEEGKSLNDRLTGLTKNNSGKPLELSQTTLQAVRKKLGEIDRAYSPTDDKANYQAWAQINAMIDGQAPAKGTPFGITQRNDDGSMLVSDLQGPVALYNKDGQVQKNFQLQQRQKDWNRMANRPPGAPQIPETGRWNRETIEFGYWQVKAGIAAQYDQMRIARMRQLAQLLGENQIMPDMFNAALEARLEAKARQKTWQSFWTKTKTKSFEGREINVLDYVDQCTLPLREKLDDAQASLDRYRKDMNDVIGRFQKQPSYSDADQKLLTNDQLVVQNLFRGTAILSEKMQVDTLQNYLDPKQPDFAQYRALLKASVTPAQEKALEETLGGQVKRWHEETSRALDNAKAVLESGDLTPESQKIQDAVTLAADKNYREFIAQVMPYHNALSTIQELANQVDVTMFGSKYGIEGPVQKVLAWIAGDNSTYAKAMKANAADYGAMPQVFAALAAGNPNAAKQLVIKLHPYAADNMAAITGAELTDAMKSDAAFKEIGANVAAVKTINGYIKVGTTMLEYAVATVAGGPIIRGALALGAELMGGTAEVAAGFNRAVAGARGITQALGATGKVIEWAGFAGKEIFMHVAANIGLVQEAGAVVRAGFVRATVAAVVKQMVRQTMFLATGGAVVGSWTALTHVYGEYVKGGESPFGSVGAAFMAGAQSNIFFFGSGAMPLIMFVGVPSSVFRGIPLLSGLAEKVANNGAVGLFQSAGKGALRLVLGTGSRLFEKMGATEWAASWRAAGGQAWLASAEELSAKKIFVKGIHEKIADATFLGMPIGKPLSYGFMQADGLTRFFGMNYVVDKAGEWWGYHEGQWSDEKDFGQRMKGANATSMAWQQTIWWAFLPQGSAHERSKNMEAYRSFEGGKEYEEKGELSRIMGADEGARLKFKSSPTWWKRLTDPYPRADTFEVTESVKDWARERAIVHELGGKSAAEVHFMELYRASKIKDGDDDAIGLKANADLRAAARSSMVTSMLDKKNQGTVAKFLDENAVGTEVDKYPVTMENQEELAFALLAAPNMIGRSAPDALVERAHKVLARYVDSAGLMKEPALKLNDAVDASVSGSIKAGLADFQARVDAAAKGGAAVDAKTMETIAADVAKKHSLGAEAIETIKRIDSGFADFRKQVEAQTKGDVTVDRATANKMLKDIAADVAKTHSLDPASVKVLDALVDYVDGTYARFNHANNVEMAHARLLKIMTALQNKSGGGTSPEGRELIDGWRAKVEKWRADHAGDPVADNMESGSANHFQAMIKEFGAEVKNAGMSDPETAAFKEAADEMRGAPWVVRDEKQTNMTGWRAEQLNGLVQILSGYALQRRGGSSASRLYQLIATGGGKTLVQFIGLLPLAESLFNRRGLDRMIYITIPALKAQAINDFVAFKVAGTRLEFGTPEDVKANIAQGKLTGKNFASKVMLIGDEADKFLFEDPQTSLGGLTGKIARLTSAYRGLDERQAGLLESLDEPRAKREVSISADVRKVLDLASKIEGNAAETAAVRASLQKLRKARGADVKAAESLLSAELSALRGRLNDRAGTEIYEAFDKVLTEMKPADDGAFKKKMASDLNDVFKEDLAQLDLFGSRESAERTMRDSFASAVELKSGLADPQFKGDRAALEKRIEVFERFSPADPGQRLSFLQDKIAEVSAGHDAAVERARAALQDEPAAPAGLAAWRAEAKTLEKGLSSEMRGAAREHEAAVGRYYKSRTSVSSLQDKISEAMLKNAPADVLKKDRLSAMGEVEKNRGEAEAAAQKLSADASGLGKKVRDLALAEGNSELKKLNNSIRKDVRGLLVSNHDEIAAEAKKGDAGWEHRVADLVAANREILKSYAGDENPVYSVFRSMHESARAWAYDERIYNAGANDPIVEEIRHAADGKSLIREIFPVLRMLAQAATGRKIDPGSADVGATRRRAAEMLRAIQLDPGMSINVKSELLWPLVGSVLWPRGMTGKGNSWVRTELMNQFAGFFEDPTGVYNNPRNGEVFTRFNGQIIPNMDIRTRRFWELKAGADITLPYEHLEVGGAEDLIKNPKANFFLFSATIEGNAKKILAEAGVPVLGEVVKPQEKAVIHLTASDAENFALVQDAVLRENTRGGDVTVNRSEIPKSFVSEIDAYMAKKGISPQKVFAVNAKSAEAVKSLSAEARSWLLEYNPKNQKGLVTAFCSDTNALMEMRGKLIAAGTKPNEIAMIFSDVQYEKANGDAKKVETEMNLGALNTGKAKILLIDSSYVIRGIDLNFKGARDDFDLKDPEHSFAGYNHVSMLFFGVQKNTEMQIIQGAGRTSPRRALPGVERDYTISADIQTAQSEEAFRGMLKDVDFQGLLKETATADWTALNAKVRASGDAALAKRYDALVESYLTGKQWADVSAQKLSASGFSRTAAPTGRFPGVEAVVGPGH